MITPLLRVLSAIVLITTILHLLVPPCLASIDAAMIRATRATQHRIYLEAHYTYRHLANYNILYGPDVVSSAWELAQFRGVVQPDPSPLSHLLAWLDGRRVPYFFSIVTSSDQLGREMKLWEHEPLNRHKFASFLWKWEQGKAKLVHVDVIPFVGEVGWDWRSVEEVVGGAR